MVTTVALISKPHLPKGIARHGIPVPTFLDTGCTANYLALDLVLELGLRPEWGSEPGSFTGWGGKVPTYGHCTVGLQLKDDFGMIKDTEVIFVISEGLRE